MISYHREGLWLPALGAPHVRRWRKKFHAVALSSPFFEFRAHVAVHRHHVDVRHQITSCYIYRNRTRRHIHTLYQTSSEYNNVPVRFEDTDVPDTMVRPSSLIGMDEQVFKAVCARTYPPRPHIYPYDVPDLHSILRPGGGERSH